MSAGFDLDPEPDAVAKVLRARLRRVAAARAAHPSGSGADPCPDDRPLAVVKPIRTPTVPEAWSAGLWGSFA